jgi:hypothetical protein
MGVDVYVLKFLCHCREMYGPFGRTLQLGRQHLPPPGHLKTADAMFWSMASVRLRQDRRRGALCGDLFSSLGSTEIVACDASPYEGATLITTSTIRCRPRPELFDTVIDGGSLEHIFIVPVALRNLMRLTGSGASSCRLTGQTIFLATGSTSQSDFAFRVFSAENGFEMLGLYLVELNDRPGSSVRRIPPRWGGRSSLVELARHVHDVGGSQVNDVVPFRRWPQQTDYALAWRPTALTRFAEFTPRRSVKKAAVELRAKNDLSPVGFFGLRRAQAGAARAALRLIGAVELWAGLWIVEGGPSASAERNRLAPVSRGMEQPIPPASRAVVMRSTSTVRS